MAAGNDQMFRRKAEFSSLWGDERMADVTITIKLKPQPAPEAGAEAEGQQQEEPPAKQARPEVSAAAAASSEEEEAKAGAEATAQQQEQQDDSDGVAATMRVHGVVLAQRSEYFKSFLMRGGAGMIEGQSKTLTI